MTKQPPRYRVRRLPEPTPPPDPRQSPELRLLAAYIEEALGTKGAYETALLREGARAAGVLNPAARYLPLGADPIFLTLPNATHQLLGWRGEVDGPGIAGLTEREAEAIELKSMHVWDEELQGWRWRTSLEVAWAMKPTRNRGMPPTSEAVDVWLTRARQKLRALFLREVAC